MSEWYEAKATEKQIQFAEAIAEELDLELPEEDTKEAYREFISEWADEFYAVAYDEDWPSWRR